MKNNLANKLKYIQKAIACFALAFIGLSGYAQTTITYSYDAQGRVTIEEYGSEYVMEFQYDEEGNIRNKTVMDTLSVAQNNRDTDIMVYPNPASSGFVIEYDFTGNRRPENILLFNIAGAIIDRLPLYKSKSRIEYRKKLAPGTYVLKAGKDYSQKVVIIK